MGSGDTPGDRGHPRGQGAPGPKSGQAAMPSLKMAAAPTRRALTEDGRGPRLTPPYLSPALTQDGGGRAGVGAGRGGRKRRREAQVEAALSAAPGPSRPVPSRPVTMDCYTANWNPLGEEAFYRKFELYIMEWNLKEDLRDCLVAAAPYGGPIGRVRPRPPETLRWVRGCPGPPVVTAQMDCPIPPTALLKNNARKEKSPSARPLLEIYSASGLLLASIPWKSGQLVQLGWTASEDLLCIQEDGTVLIYNLFCEFKRHFSMGNEVLQNHVLEAKVFHTEYGTGVAILTGAHRFSLTTNIDDLKLRRMPEVPGLQKPPSCWAVLSQDRVTIVLLAVGQDLYLLDNTSCSVVEKLCEFNSSIRSPPKQMVWCMRPRSRQRAVVVAWDRQLMVAGNSTECIHAGLSWMKTPTWSLSWTGSGSCLAPPTSSCTRSQRPARRSSRSPPWPRGHSCWRHRRSMRYGLLPRSCLPLRRLGWLRCKPLPALSHDDGKGEIPEIPDGADVPGQGLSWPSVPGVLGLSGPTLSGERPAVLPMGRAPLQKESQKADEYLREIKDQKLLPEAVSQCIEAAGYEHEPDTQKSLLRPPSGSASSTNSPRRASCACARTCGCSTPSGTTRSASPSPSPNISGSPLRSCWTDPCGAVLLTPRVSHQAGPAAALPLGHQDLRVPAPLRDPGRQPHPGPLGLLQGKEASWKALPVCGYAETSPVMPFQVQQKDKSDEEVAHAINQKLGDTPGISYSEIAARAYDCGRTELAIKLLEYEPRSGEQVPLLLKMKRSKLALSKAIESGDTDLVYTVVLHLKNELNRGTFFMTLQNQPVALSLYRQFCKHQERETLKDLYNQDDNHQELGNFHVHSSYSEKRIEGRVGALQNALDEYYKAKNEFAAKATEDQIKLLRLQRHLQEDFDKPYLDLSLHDTVSNLILDGHHKRAEQLYRDFKIPDKRYWWLKISALANRGDWEEMEKFSKSKKSPIGYLPFVEISVKHHNRYEAKKYAPRVTPEQRVKAFVLVGDLDQAADAAIEHKNETEMNFVLSKCTASTDTAVVEKLNRARAQLLKK
ncbi:vacuolar protein sorting-associated protein 16 homolog isoform 4-T4 [Alca torda]